MIVLRKLSADLGVIREGAALPSEFRLFKAGANPSTKGVDVFDERAAASVFATYREQGTDLMLDLNHDSLDPETMRARNDAQDAMAWYKLELRNGELWAVDVRWTPAGEERLRSKKQRYISPAFRRDEETGRVLELVNAALVAMPATHNAAPLVAASRLAPNLRASRLQLRDRNMTPELMKKALGVIAEQDKDSALALIHELVAAAAGASEEPPGDADAGATATNAETPPPAEGEEPKPDPEKEELAALGRIVRDELKCSNAEAIERVRALSKAEAETKAEQDKLARGERLVLVGELVKLGAETPATAWARDDKGSIIEGKDRAPIARLSTESLPELRARVVALRAARGKNPEGIRPPAARSEAATLTADEQAFCTRNKLTPEQFAARKSSAVRSK